MTSFMQPADIIERDLKIRRLEAEIERLRKALEPFAELSREYPNWPPDERAYLQGELTGADFHRARAALEPKP